MEIRIRLLSSCTVTCDTANILASAADTLNIPVAVAGTLFCQTQEYDTYAEIHSATGLHLEYRDNSNCTLMLTGFQIQSRACRQAMLHTRVFNFCCYRTC